MPTTRGRLLATATRAATRAAPVNDIINVTVTQDDRLLLTVAEAAQRLGISRSRMYELIAAGQIDTLHIGRLHKVPVEALEAFVKRHQGHGEGFGHAGVAP
jgi:excisionase family DNA binding protein